MTEKRFASDLAAVLAKFHPALIAQMTAKPPTRSRERRIVRKPVKQAR